MNYTGSYWTGSSSYYLNIEYCDVAASLIGYNDPNCLTNSADSANLTAADQIMEDASAYIFSMAATQYFNPKDFVLNHYIPYTT
jgi:hypothetical protein